MNLPQAFLEQMKDQLGEEYSSFLASYTEPTSYGLRINPLKIALGENRPELPFVLTEVPWCEEGFYADPAEHPGRHPLHEAGVYYIQEPSAMSVVSLLEPRPGEIILDLCAAPGGKSTQIAGRLRGKGLLVSNEIIPGRAKILSQNIERMGITNAIVCNEDPNHLAECFPLFFDRIVVDAPCSGEGMFRKDDTAIREWTPEQLAMCAERQAMILSCAGQMLRPGGILVYSTCTFAPQENEEQIEHFLAEHTDYELEDWRECLQLRHNATISAENCGITDGILPGTMRLWPHHLKGEGHFAVRLHKTGTAIPHSTQSYMTSKSASWNLETGKDKKKKNAQKQAISRTAKKQQKYSDFLDWQRQSLCYTIFHPEQEPMQWFGDELYRIPEEFQNLSGLKILRAGLHLGTQKKNRFEPAHALAKALTPKDVKTAYHCNYEEALLFLHGDALNIQNAKINPFDAANLQGWTLVCYEGYSLGWAKAGNGMLKNHYPKGLRIANITKDMNL